jgi:RNA polymerase sigma-70 factor (ECF subfamily)
MPSCPPDPNEGNLINAAQCGDLDAFTILYERYFPMVHKRIYYLVPLEDVEDVTQEVFISTLRSIKGYRGTAQFGTWLRTITNRQIAEYYRRRHKPESPLDERLQLSHDPNAADDVILIRQAFRRLPQNYQEVLLLRFAEGLHFEEIACLQDRTLEAIKSEFRRAIAALHVQVTRNE